MKGEGVCLSQVCHRKACPRPGHWVRTLFGGIVRKLDKLHKLKEDKSYSYARKRTPIAMLVTLAPHIWDWSTLCSALTLLGYLHGEETGSRSAN
jgi:hypothetical protein